MSSPSTLRIGIVGAGNIAGAVGRLWAEAGHQVRFGTRHPDRLGDLIAGIGPNASAGTVDDAVGFGEVLFCSVPYGAWPDLAAVIAPAAAGRIVIDSANPYPERDGAFAQAALDEGRGAGVPVARLLPGARVVRAFSSVYFRTLETEAHRAGDRVGVPIAGDEAGACEMAAGLVRDAGFAPVIAGPLEAARLFDPGTEVYNTDMSGKELAQALNNRKDEA